MSSFDEFVTSWTIATEELETEEQVELLERTLTAVETEGRLKVFRDPPKEIKMKTALLTSPTTTTANGNGTATSRQPGTSRGFSFGKPQAKSPQAGGSTTRRTAATSASGADAGAASKLVYVSEAQAQQLEDQVRTLIRTIEQKQRREEKDALDKALDKDAAEVAEQPEREAIEVEEGASDTPRELDATRSGAVHPDLNDDAERAPDSEPEALDNEIEQQSGCPQDDNANDVGAEPQDPPVAQS